MAGLDDNTPPTPLRKSNCTRNLGSLRSPLIAASGLSFPTEYLRVLTPSAEARGHGPGQEVLQVGKRDIEHRTHRASRQLRHSPVFSDGHDSGLYSWDMLYNLGKHHDELWQTYLDRLEAEGKSRNPEDNPPEPAKKGGCGHH